MKIYEVHWTDTDEYNNPTSPYRHSKFYSTKEVAVEKAKEISREVIQGQLKELEEEFEDEDFNYLADHFGQEYADKQLKGYESDIEDLKKKLADDDTFYYCYLNEIELDSDKEFDMEIYIDD